jgi:hypothetical protein
MAYLDELERELRNVLLEYEIYDVDAYGWLNDEDVDPEHVGYAMWTLTPPYEQEWLSAQHRRRPSRRASAQQQRLIELGEDFQGLMKAARYAIGMALIFRGEAFRHTGQPNPFEFHALSALTTLVMASDRARDFVILAVTAAEATPRNEGKEIKRALTAAANHGLDSEAETMRNVAKSLESLRDRRNDVVHTMALDIARLHRLLLEEERDAFEAGVWSRQRPRRGRAKFLGAQTFDDTRSVDATIQELCKSYRTVIKAGDLAYRIENRLRSLYEEKSDRSGYRAAAHPAGCLLVPAARRAASR